jgi:colanic acid/amylovoran biosynthesis protein
MKILFINCVMSNGGDAAIFQAARAVVRRAFGPSTEIIVQDDHPHWIRPRYPDLNVVGSCYWKLIYSELPGWRGRLARQLKLTRFGLARWFMRHDFSALVKRLLTESERDYLNVYRSADIVVATGGTYLVENYDFDQRLFDMSTAIALDRPLVLFTQSAGPFARLKNRRRLGRIFRAARLILLREKRSYAHVLDLQVPKDHVRIVPDAAFALADADLAERLVDPAPLSKPHPRIAISVRRWDYFAQCSKPEGMKRYCDAVVSLTTHVVRHYNAEVTFLSTCQGINGYHDDSQTAMAIKGSLAADVSLRVTVDCDFHAPDELMERLRAFDWVVATRMHFAILALGVGTPVFPIAYEFKTEELFKSLGYESDIPKIESLTSESLISAFEKSVNSYGRVVTEVRSAVERARNQAWQVVDVLRERFPEHIQTPQAGQRQATASNNATGNHLPVATLKS